MGVAGAGKTAVGTALARALGWSFRDADEFHPAANIAKMSAGIPLDDQDRAPWLAAIRRHIEGCLARGERAVVTCSGTKAKYREVILFDREREGLVYLKADRALLERRLLERPGHFMKANMLDSQLAILEEPKDALTIDSGEAMDAIIAKIREAFGL